ncbi:hypothetical protein [Sphaerisporangium dianthi]|uniref:Uncharacterized protein n=1 Tax=Sphaerisporangium dianthi TaxID=1436120 RepID=A0ABV9CMX9_9ACTN
MNDSSTATEAHDHATESTVAKMHRKMIYDWPVRSGENGPGFMAMGT